MKNKCARGNTLHHRARNAFNFPHKFICPPPPPLSHSVSPSLAFPFTPPQTGCRQTFVKKQCVSYPFKPYPFPLHSVYLLTISCLTSLVSHTLFQHFLSTCFVFPLELTCDSSSCWTLG